MISWRVLRLCAVPFRNIELYAVCRKSTGESEALLESSAPENVEFIVVDRDHLTELTKLTVAEGIEGTLDEGRFREGQLCIAAEQGDAIVGYRWLCPRLTMFDVAVIKPDPDEVYCTETVMAESPRQRGLGSGLEQAMLRLAEAEGWKSACRVVDLRRGGAAAVAGWNVTGAILLVRGHRSSTPRMWLILGDVHPIRLLHAVDDDGVRTLGLAARWGRGIKRSWQWLRHGVLHLQLLRLVTGILSWFGFCRLIFMYRKDLSEPITPCEARVSLEIDRASEVDVHEVSALNSSDPAGAERVREKLQDGSVCFIARIGGAIVACNWIRVKSAWAYQKIRLQEDEIFMTDAFTARPWRGKQIHTALNYAMLQYARDRGYRTAYTLLNASNTNSWITMPRVGWQLSGVLVYFRPDDEGDAKIWRILGSEYPMQVKAIKENNLEK